MPYLVLQRSLVAFCSAKVAWVSTLAAEVPFCAVVLVSLARSGLAVHSWPCIFEPIEDSHHLSLGNRQNKTNFDTP